MNAGTRPAVEYRAWLARIDDPSSWETLDEAMNLLGILEDARRETSLVIDMLRTRIGAEIANSPVPAVINDGRQKVRAVSKPKVRYDHGRIGDKVAAKACLVDLEDGERVDDPALAARQAVAIMFDLYVSPSTEPKKGALLDLGFETVQAAYSSVEETGKVELKVRAR